MQNYGSLIPITLSLGCQHQTLQWVSLSFTYEWYINVLKTTGSKKWQIARCKLHRL